MFSSFDCTSHCALRGLAYVSLNRVLDPGWCMSDEDINPSTAGYGEPVGFQRPVISIPGHYESRSWLLLGRWPRRMRDMPPSPKPSAEGLGGGVVRSLQISYDGASARRESDQARVMGGFLHGRGQPIRSCLEPWVGVRSAVHVEEAV